MSFRGYKAAVAEGDTVVIFLSVSNVYTFVVVKDKVFQTKYGALKHADLIGRPYGSLVTCSKGWAYVLHPTPELWTVTLPHRTQILYSTDISVVTLQLDLRPGSVVCESGTGSGSLSHAIIRTIAPGGHLYTFDFHEERAAKCREEFEAHGVGALVTVGHRDVIQDGFGLEDTADAVFLDLPLPWEAIPAAKRVMKKLGGRICSFSPCIEQVQRTCDALRKCGFVDVTTAECLQRLLEVRSITMPVLDINRSKAGTSEGTKEANVAPEASPATEVQAMDEEDEPQGESSQGRVKGQHKHRGGRRSRDYCPEPNTTFMEAMAPLQHVGHTGYLTFATLYPGLPEVNSG